MLSADSPAHEGAEGLAVVPVTAEGIPWAVGATCLIMGTLCVPRPQDRQPGSQRQH